MVKEPMDAKDAIYAIEAIAINLTGELVTADEPRTEGLRRKIAAIDAAEDALQKCIPAKPLPYRGYSGQCPKCYVVFLDSSTDFCGNCGQALDWDRK